VEVAACSYTAHRKPHCWEEQNLTGSQSQSGNCVAGTGIEELQLPCGLQSPAMQPIHPQFLKKHVNGYNRI
jgi:hypothetical protein